MQRSIPAESRAYSVLHVKAADGNTGRLFSGMATTPKPDRVEDIIEPLGVHFKNPLPLLLFHSSHMPVGSVKFGKPTEDGIPFDASIPEVSEVGDVKTLTDKAAHLVKYGLIKAVSIGFRPLKPFEKNVEFLEAGGFRFLKTEVLELSLVPIPANVDATIHTIKSFDTDGAAFGWTSGIAARGGPGVAGVSRAASGAVRLGSGMAKKTIAEQIKDWEATRAAKAARRSELMAAANDKGETLEGPEAEEYDTLTKDMGKVDEHLVRLHAEEADNARAAVPVVAAAAPVVPAPSGGGHVGATYAPIQVRSVLPPGIEFSRLVICKMASFIEMQKGNFVSALDVARARYPHEARIQAFLKAAVAPAMSTPADGPWAGTLVEPTNLANEFIEYLRPKTIIGRIPGLSMVPFNIRVNGQTSGGAGYWVGEGKPKPLTKFDFAPITLGYTKVANIAVITQEAARFSTPSLEQMVRDGLAAAIIARMDIDFVDPDKAVSAGVSPASITNGITAIPASGTTAAAFRADMADLFAAFVADNMDPSTAVLIMPTGTALALSMMVNALGQPEFPGMSMSGGTYNGLPVVASQYLATLGTTGGILILVNAADILLADDGGVDVDVSREASLEMSDAPTQVGSAGTGAALVSLWQNNLIGLRAERFVNWRRRRDDAVQWIDNVAYSA